MCLVWEHRIILRNLKHMGMQCIAITFPYDVALKTLVSSIEDVRWSNTNRCFYLEYTAENYKSLILEFDQKKYCLQQQIF